MEFDQAVRQQWRRIRERVAEWRTRAGLEAGRAAEAGRDAFDHPRIGLWARVALIVVLVLAVLYPALAWIHSTIDDDPNFGPKSLKPGMSRAVAATALLINREVHKHGWVPNAPWFSPNALLDNMPNYQTGIVEALGNFVHALGDAHPDQDLQAATDLLHYRPDAWMWNSSASQYRLAARDLRDYNAQLASGRSQFDHNAASLQTLLDRIGSDLDATAARIQNHLDTASGWPFDTVSDDVFYAAKGKLYAYSIVLKGVESDFAPVIARRGLSRQWAAMMASLRDGAGMRPWMVVNGAPDSGLFACTLCGEGFYLLRARDQLRAIRDSLSP
ncbi:MAG TPA: DUF2333 family protein [Rhizomicrobium sp.]|jgi:hypothetical protein|nr:DUF2333 family protein [Rhizomicrobium sp.]